MTTRFVERFFQDLLFMNIDNILQFGSPGNIPNGCLDAYEVKVNIDIVKYQA